MRTTPATTYRNAMADIERASDRLLEFQRQVSSGKRIQRPSDDPAGTSQLISERADIAGVEQYQRTSDSATSRLIVADTALSDMVDRLTQAQVSIVAAQGSTASAGQREVAAQTLEGIRDALMGDLNTQFQGIYIFAGADSTNPPYVAGAGGTVSAYQGSTREVAVDIDKTRAVTVSFDGSAISSGGAASDIFAVLNSAAAAARAGDGAGLAQALNAIGAAFSRATEAQTRVGTGLANIEAQQPQLVDRRLAAGARANKLEQANMADAITGMSQADAAYRAALGATSQITRQSLMDYLS